MTTFNKAIVAETDDSIQAVSDDLTITGVADNEISANFDYCLLRFTNVTIPQGDDIDEAYLTVYVGNDAVDSPKLRIHCQAADNAATVAYEVNNISARPLTTAYTEWSAADIGLGSKVSPDFKAAVQEVTDRGGWSSGNALAVILVALASPTPFRFQGYSTGTIPAITIVHSTPAAGGAVSKTSTIRLATKVGGVLTS